MALSEAEVLAQRKRMKIRIPLANPDGTVLKIKLPVKVLLRTKRSQPTLPPIVSAFATAPVQERAQGEQKVRKVRKVRRNR